MENNEGVPAIKTKVQNRSVTYKKIKKAFILTLPFAAAFCVALLVFTVPAQSQVYVGGELTADETFAPGNNPYIVTQDLIVLKNVTLTLLPGVEMQFEAGTSLVVNGTLIAKGTDGQTIKFLPKNPGTVPGLWNGLVFNNTKTLLGTDSAYLSGSVLSEAVISNASYSVTLDFSTALLIENTRISRCSFGVYLKASGYNTIRNCEFSACDFGIFMASGYLNPSNNIYRNSISGSADVGIFINSNFTQPNQNHISGNLITACNIGIHAGNYSNTGAGNNVISGNSFLRNKDAIKLFRHSNSVSNNYFMFNRNGVICWQSDYNTIKNNLFSGNVMNAVTLSAGSSFNTLSNNSMNYNSGAVLISHDSLRNSLYNTFLYNTVCENSGFSYQVLPTPQGPVQFNNLIRNGVTPSFINLSDSIVHAEYNFWGTTSESEIDSIISDINDDPLKGEVLYTPVLDNILTSAPVPPPYRVKKQRIGNDMVVSWNETYMADFKGFNVYYGTNNGIAFENKVNNGIKSSFNMGDIPVEDTIAVTTFDFLADGADDQTEGYESDFAYAVLYPYAGPDTAICYNSEYSISEATAYNYENVIWSTSGDGTFDNRQITNPVYTPGSQDYTLGYVYLFLDDAGFGQQHIDSALITFHDAPVVFAGNDTLMMADSAIWLGQATASGFDVLKWSTSGDGTFDSDTLSNPVYKPGTTDLASGEVILLITASSACGSAADEITITLDPGFSIEGRVHAGNALAPGSLIALFREKDDEIEPYRSSLVSSDGNFTYKALPGGSYYLLAVPDKSITPGYIPTYFFNDIHWGNAHKIELFANTYDVDFDLARMQVQLPAVEASLFGYCTSEPGSSESCGDVTVMLYDRNMNNILDWVRVHNGGDFRFKDLPFGTYILAGEKAGQAVFVSQPVTLSPSQPSAVNIELLCAPGGFRFSVPPDQGSIPGSGNIAIYPNPVSDFLTISGLSGSEAYDIRILNSQGSVEKYYFDIAGSDNNLIFLRTLPSGLYILELWKESTCLFRQKFIKH